MLQRSGKSHNHLGGGLGFAHLGSGQLDAGSGGGAEQVYPNQNAGGGNGSRAQEGGHRAAQNLAQAAHIGHVAHRTGDGYKHQRNHNRKEQVQENISHRFEGLAHGGGDDTNQGTGGDTAQEKNGGLILLPKRFLSGLRSHDNISISHLLGHYGGPIGGAGGLELSAYQLSRAETAFSSCPSAFFSTLRGQAAFSRMKPLS